MDFREKISFNFSLYTFFYSLGTLRARVGKWPCLWQIEINMLLFSLLYGSRAYLTQSEFVAKVQRNVSKSLTFTVNTLQSPDYVLGLGVWVRGQW